MSDIDLTVLASQPQAPEPGAVAEKPKSESAQFDPEAFKRQVLEEARREAQSLVDKSASNLTKKAQAQYDQALNALKAAGVEVTADMQANIKRSVQEGVIFDGSAAPEAAPQQSTQPAQPGTTLDPLQAAIAWAKTVGGINPQDPEYAMLDSKDIYYTTRKAVAAKEARLQSQANRTPGITMIPSAGGTPTPTAKSAQDYKKQIRLNR